MASNKWKRSSWGSVAGWMCATLRYLLLPNCLSVPVTLAYMCSLCRWLGPGLGKSQGVNSRNAVSLSVIALRRSVDPVSSLDPPGSVPKVVYVICRVYLDTKDMGNGCNLVHPGVNNHPQPPYIRDRTHMVDLAVTKHPLSVTMCLRRGQQLLDRHWPQGM